MCSWKMLLTLIVENSEPVVTAGNSEASLIIIFLCNRQRFSPNRTIKIYSKQKDSDTTAVKNFIQDKLG